MMRWHHSSCMVCGDITKHARWRLSSRKPKEWGTRISSSTLSPWKSSRFAYLVETDFWPVGYASRCIIMALWYVHTYGLATVLDRIQYSVNHQKPATSFLVFGPLILIESIHLYKTILTRRLHIKMHHCDSVVRPHLRSGDCSGSDPIFCQPPKACNKFSSIWSIDWVHTFV